MQSPRRVIVNTDAKNEADDQFAIVHALLSPSLDVRGLIPAHFGNARSSRSMLDSRDEIELLLTLMGLEGKVTVANGAPNAIPDEATPQDSPGARLIIEESKLATKDSPLYVSFLGPLTDMASAILLDPEIVNRPVAVIWIGGPGYDGLWQGGIEFNLSNDIKAANVVFDSGIEVWQVPSTVYSQVSVGYAELDARVAPYGALGKYLVEQLKEWNETHHQEPIESRSLGDSPAVSLMLYPSGGSFRVRPSSRFSVEGAYLPGKGNPIRVCESVDVRFLLEDMFHKIQRFAAESA
jgi:inosine-uridine nucleoside N-ribohydrolase